MKSLALILISLVICYCSTAALASTVPPVACQSTTCPFVPCSIAKCPRLPSAECRNDYCGGCNHRYYLKGSDVTALCDPCSSLKCPPRTVCYFDSYKAAYCAQPCNSTLPCPAGYLCRINPIQYTNYNVLCLGGSCGYRQTGYCIKEEGTKTVNT